MTDSLLACGALSACLPAFPVENAALDVIEGIEHRHSLLGIDTDRPNLAGYLMKADNSEGRMRARTEEGILCISLAVRGQRFGVMESSAEIRSS